ncbi:hypothetical protein PMN64_01925 [Bradyrhizobium sp. UFLA01-814]|uniref:hypothetical protein n=1 Tax=Bradyrhizobium sp. UFLA01-814 TaxID=3023480 RepID=UPI00398AE209
MEEKAVRLRKEAQGILPGVERAKLIRQARKAEAAARMQDGFPPLAYSHPNSAMSQPKRTSQEAAKIPCGTPRR